MRVDVSEAMRYLGAVSNKGTEALVRSAAEELEHTLQPRFTYRVLPVTRTEGCVSLGDLALPGELAGRMLREAEQAAILVCTLGAGFETLLRAPYPAPQSRSMPAAAPLSRRDATRQSGRLPRGFPTSI